MSTLPAFTRSTATPAPGVRPDHPRSPSAASEAGTSLVVYRAERLMERLRGLIGSPAPAPGHALLISPCASVHTAFMRYPIDVVFLDRRGYIRKVVRALSPWRTATCFAAGHTLEMAAGEADRLGLVPGVRIAIDLLFKRPESGE